MAQQRKVNWFAIWISVGVVVALVVVAFFVILANNQSSAPGEAPQASNIDAETGAIAVGDGPDELATYIDFMCPVCNQFEQVYGPEIEQMVDDGSITLGIHPISILDRLSNNTQFSTRSANAAYCVAVADADASLPFLQAMFENQPAENSSGLTNSEIIDIASGVGVTGIDSCVNDGTYAGYVAAMTEETPIQPGQSGIATPTIAVNGEVIANTDLPAQGQLATLFG